VGKCKMVHCTGCERTKGIYPGKKLENLKRGKNIGGCNGEANCLSSLAPAKHDGK
jgi:hypothetical protein